MTMLASEEPTNDEHHLAISPNSANPTPTLPQYKLLLLLPRQFPPSSVRQGSQSQPR